MTDLHHGMDSRDALDKAKQMGCEVRNITGTGELIVSHPSQLHRVRINGRRKDAPRSLTGFLLSLPADSNERTASKDASVVPGKKVPNPQDPIAVALTRAIRSSGMTPTEVAREVGCGRGTLGNWCAGYGRPNQASWDALCRVLPALVPAGQGIVFSHAGRSPVPPRGAMGAPPVERAAPVQPPIPPPAPVVPQSPLASAATALEVASRDLRAARDMLATAQASYDQAKAAFAAAMADVDLG